MDEEIKLQVYQPPVFPPKQETPSLPQVIEVGGQLYRVLPAAAPQEKTQWLDNPLAIVGLGLLVGFSVGSIAILATGQVGGVPVEPLVIDRPVAIPQTIKPNCIAFCGGNN